MPKDKAKQNEGIKADPKDIVSPEHEEERGPGEYSSGTLHDDITGETDPDSMVHEQEDAFLTDNVEQDLDDVVHEEGTITTGKAAAKDLLDEEDIDDLVHRDAEAGER